MIVYVACFVIGLLGIGLVFAGYPDHEPLIIPGAALYFIALFVAAIHSMQGALI